MKFDAVVGNPPYQEETAKAQSETNGQAPRTNIFHYFQIVADQVSDKAVSLIYPGGRWIHRFGKGKGFAQFGLNQINDCKLKQIDFYVDANEIFNDVAIADGISIVLKDVRKTEKGFTYVYHRGGDSVSVHVDNPGEALLPLNPNDSSVIGKVETFVKGRNYGFMFDRVLPRSLFGVESNFVSINPNQVRPYTSDDNVDFSTEIKLFTNDKAGKAGRAKWYVAKRSVIKSNQSYIDEWKVVVSSANAGGQKRDNQIEIIDNHSAFGRARVALGSFKTKEEAQNFFNYCKTYLVRFMFLMTDESLTSLGKKVPDIMDYSSANAVVDFSSDLNAQLYALVGLTENEIQYIENTVNGINGDTNGND